MWWLWSWWICSGCKALSWAYKMVALPRRWVVANSIAYWQGTSKREGAQSVHQSIKITQKPPTPAQTPK